MTIDETVLQELAERLAELLAPRLARRPLVDAETLAPLLGVERDWVYRHAAMLGARRLGEGPRARLRFDVDEAIAALPCLGSRGSERAAVAVARPSAPLRRRRSGTGGSSVPTKPLEARGRRVV